MNVTHVTVNGKVFDVIPTRWQDFWSRVSSGQWEPETFKLFDRFITKNTSYIDIGAWIGPTVLYAAQLANAAYAFEPDPLAFADLSANLGLNPQIANVHIFPLFVGNAKGKVKMGSRQSGGDSMSSALFASMQTNWQAESVRLDEFIVQERLHAPLFIKIDIEGGEYLVIPKLRSFFKAYRPTVYLSLHPSFLATSLQRRSGTFFLKISNLKLRLAVMRLWFAFTSFPYVYDVQGNRIAWNKEFWRILRSADLTKASSIVATYQPWH
jgi:FkbM family methyltransferase